MDTQTQPLTTVEIENESKVISSKDKDYISIKLNILFFYIFELKI